MGSWIIISIDNASLACSLNRLIDSLRLDRPLFSETSRRGEVMAAMSYNDLSVKFAEKYRDIDDNKRISVMAIASLRSHPRA